MLRIKIAPTHCFDAVFCASLRILLHNLGLKPPQMFTEKSGFMLYNRKKKSVHCFLLGKMNITSEKSSFYLTERRAMQ